MWQETCDTREVMSIASKFHLPCFNCLGGMMFWRFGGKASVSELINELDRVGPVDNRPSPTTFNTLSNFLVKIYFFYV